MARTENMNELLAGLSKHKSGFSFSLESSIADVKASYLTANKIASASKPYSEGEFAEKQTLLKLHLFYFQPSAFISD